MKEKRTKELETLILNFGNHLSLPAVEDTAGFMRLLIESDEIVQVKDSKFRHPYDAEYLSPNSEPKNFDNKFSADG